MCVVRFPSVPLSRARYEALSSGVGVKIKAASRETVLCNSVKRRPLLGTHNLHWLSCYELEALVGKAVVMISAHSLVETVRGRELGTGRTFRASARATLRGTQLDFRDLGVPRESRSGVG